jgi:4-hydroxy-tetrahydrodipicolinate synthase
MGSTGEASMLTPEEKRDIVSATLKWKTPDMQLWYGCTGNNTASSIKQVKHASAEGADGVVVTVPSYVVPSEEESVRFFLDVADASTVPVGIYNNPTRVKTDLSAAAMIRIAEHPNIVLLKEATSRGDQIARIARARQHLSIMCCDSPNLGLVMQVMALGGQGTANMGGNIIPREMATISTPWRNFADVEAFRDTYLKVLPLLHFHYSAINPVAVKSLARALGLPAGPFRRPLLGLSEDALAKGVEIVRELGIAEQYGYRLGDKGRVLSIGRRTAAE